MPDDMPFFSSKEFKVPSLANSLLAANAVGHEVFVADLTLRRQDVAGAVRQALRTHRPQVVGLSAMSFQYDTACHVARLVRGEFPETRIVLGGYHATLMYEEIYDSPEGELFDFMFRGEADHGFRELLDALERNGDLRTIRGLSFRTDGTGCEHNEPRPLEDLSTVRIPDRGHRLWSGYRYGYMSLEMIETSRGCTMPCNFCSIRRMYGRSFRPYDLERVIADIADATGRGCRAMLIADDNITLDVPRLIELCKRIVRARLNHVFFIVQASSRGIASSEELVTWLDRANFRAVFLGMENASAKALKYVQKGDIVEQSRQAVQMLHRRNILVVGGVIVGFPWDTEEELVENFEFLRELNVDFFGDQVITPYPKTGAREDQLAGGMVVNKDDFRWYNGFWANVRTEHLSADELLFRRCVMHRKYTTGWAPPALRTVFPALWVFQSLVNWPLKSIRRAWQLRNSTLRQFFEREMTRYIMQNNFFGDRKPYRPFDEIYGARRSGIVVPHATHVLLPSGQPARGTVPTESANGVGVHRGGAQ